jgi:hypothetical protein
LSTQNYRDYSSRHEVGNKPSTTPALSRAYFCVQAGHEAVEAHLRLTMCKLLPHSKTTQDGNARGRTIYNKATKWTACSASTYKTGSMLRESPRTGVPRLFHYERSRCIGEMEPLNTFPSLSPGRYVCPSPLAVRLKSATCDISNQSLPQP